MIRFRRTNGARPEPRADAQTEHDLLALYEAPVPRLAFSAPGGAGAPQRGTAAKLRRPILIAAALGVVAATVAFVPGIWGGETTPVIAADEVFQRASEAASASTAQTSYHFVATSAWAKAALGTTETWSRDASHWRNQTTDNGVSFDGDEMWLWANIDGVDRAVHAKGGASEFTGNDKRPGSLTDLLGQYSDSSCQTATLESDATVAGRAAYVLDVTPRESCPKLQGRDVKGAGSLRMWIDKETFVTLKTQASDSTGVVYTYEVTEFESGIAIPDSAFQYQPPAGVQVTEVASAADAKLALAGSSDDQKKAAMSDPNVPPEKKAAVEAGKQP